MYKLIQKYQRKLLAVFAVLLMIAFVATLGYRGPSGGRSNMVVAYMGKTPVYDGELHRARDEWAWLSRFAPRSRFSKSLQAAVLASPLAEPTDQFAMFQAEQFGNAVCDDIEKHPELFLLLQNDAQNHSVRVSDDQVNRFLVNTLGLSASSANTIGFEAVKGLLLVRGELEELASAPKVSRPQWQHDLSQEYQAVRLNLVDFGAAQFEKGIAAPTPQQLRQQFDKYKNTLAESTSADDPLGFGYEIPARVKLQYIQIPRRQVADAIMGSPDPKTSKQDQEKYYNWELKAAEYYQQHADEFRNQPPATKPATQPASGPSTEPSGAVTQPAATQAATEPALKPFAQVKVEIITRLVESDVEQQMGTVQREITSQLSNDWIAIRRADEAATRPATTEPATSGQSPATQPLEQWTSFASLEQLRARILDKFHVAIVVSDLQEDWLSSNELAKLPGIGSAHTEQFDEFPKYAVSFTGQQTGVTAPALQVWQPSVWLSDTARNAYLFRLTAAQAPHAPPDMAPLAGQLEKDWKLAQAYERARQEAQKVLDASKTLGLSQAARAAGAPMITIGPFRPGTRQAIPGYAIGAAARAQLDAAARQLLEAATPDDRHPERLVELTSERRVLVAELAGAQLVAPQWIAQYMVGEQDRQRWATLLAQEWFNYDAVVARLGYKVVEKGGA